MTVPQPKPQPQPGTRERRLSQAATAGTWLLLSLMAVTVVVGAVGWVDASTFWPTGDSKFHLENLWSTYHQLSEGVWMGLPITRYPPGFYLFAGGLMMLLGDSMAAASVAQALCAAALLLLTYLIGRTLQDRVTGLLAAAMLSSSLLLADATRQFYLDLPSAVPMALVLWALVADPELAKRRWALLASAGLVGIFLVRTGTMPLLFTAWLVAVAQASGRRPTLSLATVLAVCGLGAGALLSLEQSTRRRLVVETGRAVSAHADALGVALPILGVLLLALGIWLHGWPRAARHPLGRAGAAVLTMAGACAALLGHWLAGRLADYVDYLELSVFTDARLPLSQSGPAVLANLGDMVVSGPIGILAGATAVVGALQWRSKGLRTLSLGAMGGLAFVVFVSDGWIRYTTPVLAPIAVLAALPLARAPVLRWGALAWWVSQGAALWLGWAVWDHPGIDTTYIHQEPVLSMRPPHHERYHYWGYAGQYAPWFTIPIHSEPWIAEEWYHQLQERGHLRTCRWQAISSAWAMGKDDLGDLRFLATKEQQEVAFMGFDPSQPMPSMPCLTVSVREPPAGDDRVQGESRVAEHLELLSRMDGMKLAD